MIDYEETRMTSEQEVPAEQTDGAAESEHGEMPEKTFSQSEVDRIVAERLARERRRVSREKAADGDAETTPEESEESGAVVRDLDDIKASYPALDAAEVLQDPGFAAFGKGRFGAERLAEIYADYAEVMQSAADRFAERQKNRQSRATAAEGGAVGNSLLTEAQQDTLREWNERYPSDAMTEKEFAYLLNH